MTIKLRFVASLALVFGLAAASVPAQASGGDTPHLQSWSFAGPFGQYDKAQLRRGFQVFQNVCVSCHTLENGGFRNLPSRAAPNWPLDEVRQLAASWPVQVKDINDKGDPMQRAPKLPDRIPSQYANEAAARIIHNGAVPPDLSVIAKARTFQRGFPWWVTDIFTQYNENGVDYIVALLNGYEDPPERFKVPDGSFYNKYFPGHIIGMTPPIADGLVTYGDGTPETQLQYSKDVAAFLMWAAEPTLDVRKRIGWWVLGFLVIFTGLLVATKIVVWRPVKKGLA
uniref:Cytochrome c1 n=1 Tax=Blastochloris viridis TaxID=1079 RepID=CY1_BLAVI|nr:RecName: Full=Cytochrome c1; Flags: Precursor [Blastochloris viridis]